MNIRAFFKRSQQFLTDNSPALLAGAGIAGTIGTAYLSWRAGYKSALIIDEAERIQGEDATFRDKLYLTWMVHVPAAATGVATIASIAAGNRITTRRAVALSAAYTLSERAFTEYRDQVVEKIGEAKELKVRDAVAQKRTEEVAPYNNVVLIEGEGKVLVMDAYSGRSFKSDMETLKKAQNDVNYEALHNLYVSLNEFYDRVGLERVPLGDEVGWNSDHMMELQFSSTLTPKMEPCLVFTFDVDPIRKYYKAH